ncbi:MAG: peptidase dimerization domain-containing protein [Thermomicrobiales bacterium]
MDRATVQTPGGHGGYPQISPNAILVAGDVLRDLQALSEIEIRASAAVLDSVEASRDRLEETFGAGTVNALTHVTVNAGVISGGDKVNMIAASCRVEVDIRTPVGVSTDEVLERIDEILSRHEGASYRIINRAESNACEPDHELVGIIQRNAEAARESGHCPRSASAGQTAGSGATAASRPTFTARPPTPWAPRRARPHRRPAGNRAGPHAVSVRLPVELKPALWVSRQRRTRAQPGAFRPLRLRLVPRPRGSAASSARTGDTSSSCRAAPCWKARARSGRASRRAERDGQPEPHLLEHHQPPGGESAKHDDMISAAPVISRPVTCSPDTTDA